MKRKVCVVVTARPSYSRVKTALHAIEEHVELQLQLVVSSSALLDKYGNAIQYIKKDGFKIAAQVYNVIEGENPTTMAKTTGLSMLELSTVFDNLKPHIVVTIADRYETISTAIAASFMNIPVAHIQGGEITGSIDEKVRHAVTKLSNIHFASTEKAAERIIRMGEDPKSVFVTGCPSIDLAAEALAKLKIEFDPFERYGGVGDKFDLSNGYIVVLQHPVTTEYKKARRHITETLHGVSALQIPTMWFWPNVDAGSDGTSKGIRVFRENEDASNIHFFKNIEPEEFLELIHNSRCIVGNSSVAIREGSYLGIPAVNIGSRQDGRERGRNVIDVDYNKEKIMEAIRYHLKNGHLPPDKIYGDSGAGQQIADLLACVPLTIEKRLYY